MSLQEPMLWLIKLHVFLAEWHKTQASFLARHIVSMRDRGWASRWAAAIEDRGGAGLAVAIAAAALAYVRWVLT